MNIVERVKKLLLTPAAEWNVIAEEKTQAGPLITGYVLPLAAISAVAGFVGGSIIGQNLPFVGYIRTSIVAGLGGAVLGIVLTVAGVFVISLIINALAPTFGAEKNAEQAFKVAVYSGTPAWVAGVFQIWPALGLLVLLASLYGLYLLYLGLTRLMKCPQDRALGYTAVVVVCAIAVFVVGGTVSALVIGTTAAGSGILSGLTGGGNSSSAVEIDTNSPLGKLESLGRSLEESAKKADAAEKAGDAQAQVAAGLEGLGALLGGGSRVDPIDIAQLKTFVPDTFAGMPKRSSSAEKTGFGVMVSKAEATYGDGAEKEVTLELLDTGGASGLMSLASWMGVQEEKENDDGYERTRKEGGRMVHEKVSKRGQNEFGVVLGERFLVSAKGRGLDVAELKAAVSGLDLAKLEAMKGAGVQK
jgi:hypothetical protein